MKFVVMAALVALISGLISWQALANTCSSRAGGTPIKKDSWDHILDNKPKAVKAQPAVVRSNGSGGTDSVRR